MPTGDLPDAAFAAALASVPAIEPQRLRRLLQSRGPRAAWDAVAAGGVWAPAIRQVDVAGTWAAHLRARVRVLVRGGQGYPAALADDPDAPPVLFALGDPSVLGARPRVAVVGTRASTRYGLGVAAQLGADLAAAGVTVVSGLALGIDGAAHEGATAGWRADPATAGPPVAVVPGPLDRPYPPEHARLWQRVAEAGVVLSDVPVGIGIPRWRYARRNRVMAALADVVVVVECHATGGSLHTVRAAVRRGRSVGAVPGSVRSPASSGTNDLLADGCFVVRDVADVLVALGLARAAAVPVRPRRRGRRAAGTGPAGGSGGDVAEPAGGSGGDPAVSGRRAAPEAGASPPDPGGAPAGDDGAVLRALEHEPCSVEELLGRTGLPLAAVAASLERLRLQGRAHGRAGWWEAL